RDARQVVATHFPASTASFADAHWRPAEKRLVMSLDRFDWAGSLCEPAQFQRRRTALRFDRVNSIKCRNVNCKDRRAMFNLLAVEFDESDPPGGVVTLIFSGGAALRLEVECLECELVDLGPMWTETCRPTHDEDVDDVRTA